MLLSSTGVTKLSTPKVRHDRNQNWYTGHRNKQISKTATHAQIIHFGIVPRLQSRQKKCEASFPLSWKPLFAIFIRPIVFYFQIFEERTLSRRSQRVAQRFEDTTSVKRSFVSSPHMYIHVYTLVYVYTYVHVPEFVWYKIRHLRSSPTILWHFGSSNHSANMVWL